MFGGETMFGAKSRYSSVHRYRFRQLRSHRRLQVDFIIWNENRFTDFGVWCSGDFNADVVGVLECGD